MPANGIRASLDQGANGSVLQNSSVSARRHGKMRARPGAHIPKKVPVVTEEVLEVERASLIAEKRAQLEEVVEMHDTLVRLNDVLALALSSQLNTGQRNVSYGPFS